MKHAVSVQTDVELHNTPVTLRVLSPRVCVCNVYVPWSLPYVTTGSSFWRRPQFERNVQTSQYKRGGVA